MTDKVNLFPEFHDLSVLMGDLNRDLAAEVAEPHDTLEFLRDYHVTRGRHLSVGISAMLDWEREAVADFLDLMSLNMKDGFAVLTAEEVTRIADTIRDGTESPVVLAGEPWLSSFKFTKAEVVPLHLMVLKHCFTLFPLIKLIGAGFDQGERETVVERLRRIDLPTMESLSRALDRLSRDSEVDGLRAVQVRRNVDFVLACSGDREAMARMAFHVAESLRGFYMANERLDTEIARRVTLARSWHRLSVAYWSDPDSLRPVSFGASVLSIKRVWLLDLDTPHSVHPPEPHVVFPSVPDSALPVVPVFARMGMHFWPEVRYHPTADELDMVLSKRKSNTVRWCQDDIRPSRLRRRPRNFRIDPGSEVWKHYSAEAEVAVDAPAAVGVFVPNAGTKQDADDDASHLRKPLPLKKPTVGADELYAVLTAEFPWMKQANLVAARSLASSAGRDHGHWFMRPLLLLGPPGIGKTRWVRRLAELVGVPRYAVSLSGEDTSRAVTGYPRGWNSEAPSQPARGFAVTKTANYVFHGDDVDRAIDRLENVVDAFVPMVSPETAAVWPEAYHRGTLDLSRVSFVFTATDTTKIRGQFLSKVRTVPVIRPSWPEVERVLPVIFSERCEEAGIAEGGRPDFEIFVSRSTKAWENRSGFGELRRIVDDMVEEAVWSPPGPKLSLVTD